MRYANKSGDYDEQTKAGDAALNEAIEKLRDEGKVGYLSSFPCTVGFAEKVVESGRCSMSSVSRCSIVLILHLLQTP